MNAKSTVSLEWYNKPVFAIVQIGIGLLLAYVFALRALDTGSLQQYGIMVLCLLIIGIKAGSLIAARPAAKKKKGDDKK